MTIKRVLIAASLVIAFLLPAFAAAQQFTVAAAADLSNALGEVAANYEKQSGTTVRLVYGSSGALFTQIQNGAPFDVFLSADEGYPTQLVEANLAEKASYSRYAQGGLVVWVPPNSQLNVEQHGIDVLLDPSVKKIAIANPQHAPYGKAAVAALQHFDLYERVQKKLVFGENVSQAAQFVDSGNAQVGLVARSHAFAPGRKENGTFWTVPLDAYPALVQAAVVLTHSAHKKEAGEFLEYLKSADAKAVLVKYGFGVPARKP